MREKSEENADNEPDSPKPNALQGITLGYPLDQLLDQGIELGLGQKPAKQGIKLPDEENGAPGTGTIIICGPPGSGKTTLGLQLAVACAGRIENNAVSAFISLESTIDEIKAKAQQFGWDKNRRLCEVKHMDDLGGFSTPDTLAENLYYILAPPENPQECPAVTGQQDAGIHKHGNVRPCVLLPLLSPRDIVDSEESADAVFWRRFKQVECLLMAAKRLQERELPEVSAILPLVVVDSLNMFGEGPLKRSHIHQLFRLFKRYGRIGVFLAETGDAMPFDSTIADVVIKLTATKEHGYFVRYIEVEKSRYSRHVLGLHPFKTISRTESSERTADREDSPNTPPLPARIEWWKKRGRDDYQTEGEPPRWGLVAFPSLHYTVLRTEHSTEAPKKDPSGGSEGSSKETFAGCFPFDSVYSVIPGSLPRQSVVTGRDNEDYLRGSTLMIEGDRSTYKTNLALSFLADGLVKADESVMLIRFSDTPLFQPKDKKQVVPRPPAARNLTLQKDDKAKPDDLRSKEAFSWELVEPDKDDEKEGVHWKWQNLVPEMKALLRSWKLPNPASSSRLFELDLKGGNLLPEEFVQFVIDVLIRRMDLEDRSASIRRVVLDDVSQIGVSYPFLRESLTAGNLFLPALVHVLRNFGVDVVMVGTTSDLPEGDEAVRRARALADAVVSCRFVDVFGKRHVAVSGGAAKEEGETGLPVVRLMKTDKGTDCFDLDTTYLEGLVGLETGNPHRPGLILHVFQGDATIQGEYNREMATMLRAGLARPERRRLEAAGAEAARMLDIPSQMEPLDVSVEPFNSQFSEAIHDALELLPGKPLDRTVLYAVDEFLAKEAKEKDLFLPPVEKEREESERNKKRLNKKDLILWEEEKRRSILEHVWPYYYNVLLIAYNTDWIKVSDPKETNPWRTWQEVLDAVNANDSPGTVPARHPFWYDQTARETLSCMLLDALIAGNRKEPSDSLRNYYMGLLGLPGRDRRRLGQPWQTNEKNTETEQLKALCDLLREGRRSSLKEAKTQLVPEWEQKEKNMKKAELEELDRKAEEMVRFGKLGLPPDAKVYMCWYSHLRELTDRNPRLAEKLRVCALPGLGFRGDWYIGILKGSVSAELGRQAIRILCRKDEEYKRFARGVGLPVRTEFRDKGGYFAWPLAPDVPVSRVFQIHKCASLRSDIESYTRIRSTLSMVAWQLSRSDGDARNAVKTIAGNRLFEQLRMLAE